MALLDLARFPVVRLMDEAGAGEDWETELDDLLGRGEAFVLVTARIPGGEEESPGERKRRALWFKRNRRQFMELCAGAVVIEAGRPIAAPMRMALEAVGKAFGAPLAIVGDDAEALAVARRMLAKGR